MTIKKILVIRFRRVGDSVLSMALCHSLKQTFPDAEIHFVINKGIAPLYINHPDIQKIITFNDRELKGLTYIKKVKEVVTATHYDVIIDMRSTPKTLPFSLFSLSTPYRIGRCKPYNHLIHNYRVSYPVDYNRVESNLAMMEPLSCEAKLIKDTKFPLYITEKEKSDYHKYMEQQGIDFNRPIILAAIATRIVGKSWPKEKMITILKNIIGQHEAQIIFNYGGEAEKAVATDYYESLGSDRHIFLNIEAKGLRELCALCANSHFFFGNEGGPRHISQAFSVPSFAIYPPNISKQFWLPNPCERYQGISPDEFMPLEQQLSQKLTYQERMNLIPVESVWERLHQMLSRFLPAIQVIPTQNPINK